MEAISQITSARTKEERASLQELLTDKAGDAVKDRVQLAEKMDVIPANVVAMRNSKLRAVFNSADAEVKSLDKEQ